MSSQTPLPGSSLYACLHGKSEKLERLAQSFSPIIQVIDTSTVVFSIDGLGRLIGGTEEIASAISHRGQQMDILANLAIASNPDTALQANIVARQTFRHPARQE